MSVRLINGDCRELLRTLPDASVQCCVTSPPYYNLRSYIDAAHPDKALEIGAEKTPDEYVAALVGVFREVKRVLRPDGVCFINLGDSYCSGTHNVRYELREDCTLTELQDVALAVLGVRITGHEAAREGDVPSVLPSGLRRSARCGGSDVSSEGVEEELSTQEVGCNSGVGNQEQATEGRCYKRSWGEASVLRGGNSPVSDVGSYQRRRRVASEKDGAVNSKDLSTGASRGLSKAQISHPVFQLQLRDRIMGLLSARQFTEAEVPASVRACFKTSSRIKPKDLLGIPWMVAFAMRADGWYLRSAITWAKPNPMAESCRDRPTSSYEMVFLLAKSATYFIDMETIREPVKIDGNHDHLRMPRMDGYSGARLNGGARQQAAREYDEIKGANCRNVWTIATQPFPGQHYATFPSKLAERCIKAGTSEAGACPHCGAPWKRLVEKGEPDREHQIACGGSANDGGYNGTALKDYAAAKAQNASDVKRRILEGMRTKRTTGWRPTCSCPEHTPVPCVVLDCFAGSGTTGMVADRLGRDAVLIELKQDGLAQERITRDCPLFAEVVA